jgi:DNA-binding beta-propeller fold protein YncE
MGGRRCVASIALAVSALLAGATMARAAESKIRLLVLDGAAGVLHAVDPVSGQIQQSVEVGGHPLFLMPTPDGGRILILDTGPGKVDGDRGWAGTGKSSLSVVDVDKLQLLGRVELGWGISLGRGPVVSADGSRLAVYCPGYRAKKAEESLATEVVVVDVAAVKEVGRVTLDRWPIGLVSVSEGRRVCVVLPRVEQKKAAPIPAQIIPVDLATGVAASPLPLDAALSDIMPSPDGRLLYLLEPGKPSGNPAKNVNGRLHVVAVEGGAPTGVLDAGSGPHGMVYERASDAVLILATAAPVKGVDEQGELRVVRGDKLERVVPIARDPLFLRLSQDGRELYALSNRALHVLSLPDLKPLREVPIEGAGTNWTSDAQPGPPNDLATTPDGSRLLVTYTDSSKLLIMDLKSGAKVESISTGRKGAKLAKVAAATAMNAASYYAARGVATRSGQSTFFYDRYSPRAASTGMALREDGRFAYVLNSQTNDVTIVDPTNGKVIEKLGGGGYEVRSLPTGKLVAAVSNQELHLIDATSNTTRSKVELPGLFGLAIAPNDSVAVALAEKSVLLLDPASGTVKARIDTFAGNTDGLFIVRQPPKPAPKPKVESETPAATPKPKAKTKKPAPKAR